MSTEDLQLSSNFSVKQNFDIGDGEYNTRDDQETKNDVGTREKKVKAKKNA